MSLHNNEGLRNCHAKSDLDFLVEFEPLPPASYADTYFGLMEALEELFGRPIDLVVASAVRNSCFRASVERTRPCSMPRDAKKYLYDINQAAALIAQFTAGKSFAISERAMLRAAAEGEFEIIGEVEGAALAGGRLNMPRSPMSFRSAAPRRPAPPRSASSRDLCVSSQPGQSARQPPVANSAA